MLQHEFEELIGRKATEAEYIEANAMYMEAGDVDKFDFCEEWLYLKRSKVARALCEKIRSLQEWQHKGLPYKRWLKLSSEPFMQGVEFLTTTGQWACIKVLEQTFEYMEDEDDEETYVSGNFKTDGTNLIIDYDGVYELPALVKRGFEILSYDLSEL